MVNIFIIVTSSIRFRNITKREFRWKMVLEFVTMTDHIDSCEQEQDPTRMCGADTIVDRYQGVKKHHHATWPEYVFTV